MGMLCASHRLLSCSVVQHLLQIDGDDAQEQVRVLLEQHASRSACFNARMSAEIG